MEPKTPQRKLREECLEKIHNASTTINIPLSPFMKNLGYGTGINVYRLERSASSTGRIASPWAVKRVSYAIRKYDKESRELYNERILKEAEILRKLKHPNIVGFRDIIKGPDGEDTLALECCTTSLGKILEDRHENGQDSLPANQIKKMIEDIALALDYLHTEAKLLHADIKSFNILVKDEFDICKLCDFGVSLPLNANGFINFSKQTDLCYIGTDLWSAPEVINEEEIITSSADIFSFGLVIYETIALVPPHTLNVSVNGDVNSQSSLKETTATSTETTSTETTATMDCDESQTLSEIDDDRSDGICNAERSLYGTRPPLPQAFELSDEYRIIVEMFYVCTNEEPSERPTAKELWQSLQRIKT